MRTPKRLAALTLALGAALAGSVTTASATTVGGVQLAPCTSANHNDHLVWIKFTKADGSTFCVGGGIGTVIVNADITAWDGWGTGTPVTEYYGDLHYDGGYTIHIGEWGAAQPPYEVTYVNFSLPCTPLPPPYNTLCKYPLNQPSVHVDDIHIVGVYTG